MTRHRASLLLVSAVLAGAAAASAAAATDARSLARAAPVQAASSGGSLLAVTWNGETAALRRLDPVTLRPVTAAAAPLGRGGFLLCSSPDGRRLVLGSTEPTAVRVVDTASLRLVRLAGLPFGSSAGCVWGDDGRLRVLLAGATGVELHTIPESGDAPAIGADVRSIGGVVNGSPVTMGSTLVALLAPDGRIGAATLLVVRGDGSVARVALPGVRAGFRPPQDENAGARMLQALPGLALSPDGLRAVVVPERGPLVEVDLATLRVTAHAVAASRATAVAAKSLVGYSRVAAWLPSGRIAVTGGRWTTTGSGDQTRMSLTPAGLVLVDPRTWAARRVDAQTSELHVAAGRIVAVRRNEENGTVAVSAYTADGTLAFRAPPSVTADLVVASGGYVYLGSDSAMSWVILDAATGKQVGDVLVKASIDLLEDEPAAPEG